MPQLQLYATVTETVSLNADVFVQALLPRLVARESIENYTIPICYLEKEESNALKRLTIHNYFKDNKQTIKIIRGKSFVSKNKDIEITNKFDGHNPLFYKQVLPNDATNVSVQIETNKGVIENAKGFLIEGNVLYTNYQNHAEELQYKFYRVSYQDSAGNNTSILMNLSPVVDEATWEDIDLDTGLPYEDRIVYKIVQNGNEWEYSFSRSDTFYIRPAKHNALTILKPSNTNTNESWFIRINNFWTEKYINGQLRNYKLPEYDTQAFSPIRPFTIVSGIQGYPITEKIIKSNLETLYIDPNNLMHVTLYIYDEDGILYRVITSDSSLHGLRYEDDIDYEADKIISFDNRNGFIELNLTLNLTDLIFISGFSKTNYYQVSDIDFNGRFNENIKDLRWLLYVKPDQEDQALGIIGIDRNGTIVQVYDQALALKDSEGNFNVDTILDMQIEAFLEAYVAGYNNDSAYLLIGEVFNTDSRILNDFAFNRLPGISSAGKTSGLQAWQEDFEDLKIPTNTISIVKYPIDLLEDFEGRFSEPQIKENLKRFINAQHHLYITSDYPECTITGDSVTTGEIELEFSWEGPDYNYLIYRKSVDDETFNLIDSVPLGARGTVTYTDTGLTSGIIYDYAVCIEDTVRYPMSKIARILCL